MTVITVEVIIREAGPSHQPRSLSNHFRVIAVGVAVNTIKHLAVAVD